MEVRYGGIIRVSNPLLSRKLLFEIIEPLRLPALVDGGFPMLAEDVVRVPQSVQNPHLLLHSLSCQDVLLA